MRNGISINLNWKFKKAFIPEYLTAEEYDDFENINIPHTVKEIPYDCFDQTLTCGLSTYVRFVELEETENKRILLLFEGVSASYELYVNAHLAGHHKGAYSGELFDISNYVHGGKNKITLVVDSNERGDIPPNGSTVDYLIYGGIYRDVTLFVQEKTYIEQVLFRYDLAKDEAIVYPEIKCSNHGPAFVGRVEVSIFDSDQLRYHYGRAVEIGTGYKTIQLEKEAISQVRLWETGSPNLYRIEISLWEEGRLLDESSVRIGFRTLDVTPNGFFLNGEKTKLIGLNRHQSYPYIGYAMGKRAQQKDAEILKDLGINMVRCSHYMQSRHFLDRCDELGLLVFEEIPGWGHIGGEKFKEVVMADLDNMVLTHYNHPSIVIWGTRLNESADDDELYEKTSQRCKELDPGRPTTGVRWQKESRLFEDIYSYNDYTPEENGKFLLQEPEEVTKALSPVPYLLSEHVGALLPTKPDDNEERQEKFALYHAEVLNKVRMDDRYLGALGWCMFDYNTHNDHNSEEKICFHGVLDMFRVPKWAAYFYKSQKDPAEEVVLEPCSMVGRGERTEPVPFYVLTNCDYIDVTLSADITRRYYPSKTLRQLAHPPIEVDKNGEFWQNRWKGASIVGYIDGREAVRRTYSDNPRLDSMLVKADDTVLYNDRVDETRIVCTFVDENKNRLYFHKGVVMVETQGEIKLIGPNLIPTMGGTAAFWIKTRANGVKEKARIILKTGRDEIETKIIEIELI
ncbi:MAG: glycoside hydrolase family 2 TIM barrel-domain containing protein [Lachnospiraceae bacterium]